MFLIKSFARRIGKSLSSQKKNIILSDLPNYLFSKEKIDNVVSHKKVILEIGFGMGEHFLHQIKTFPDTLFLGAEVYLNGVANVVKFGKENNYDNFFVWPDNIDIMLPLLPPSSIHIIYILFPDPWPKKNQRKKRLINNFRLSLLIDKLKPEGKIFFATDIADYFTQSVELCMKQDNIIAYELTDSYYPENYIFTKYHKKSIEKNRQAQFLMITKIN